MRFTLSSTRFVAELERRIANSGVGTSSSLVVPEELSWWYIQEFGTTEYYPIDPVYADELVFPDPDHYGEVIRAKHVNHPPIMARHMVSSVINDIRDVVQSGIRQALVESNYDGEYVKSYLVEELMPQVKQIIVESFAERLPGTREDGRLLGQSASEVFESDAEIVEN